MILSLNNSSVSKLSIMDTPNKASEAKRLNKLNCLIAVHWEGKLQHLHDIFRGSALSSYKFISKAKYLILPFTTCISMLCRYEYCALFMLNSKQRSSLLRKASSVTEFNRERGGNCYCQHWEIVVHNVKCRMLKSVRWPSASALSFWRFLDAA